MKRLINKLMGAVKHYTTCDFAIFKIYMVAIGILFGTYFAPFWGRYLPVVWGVAIVGCVVVLAQLIRYAKREKDKN